MLEYWNIEGRIRNKLFKLSKTPQTHHSIIPIRAKLLISISFVSGIYSRPPYSAWPEDGLSWSGISAVSFTILTASGLLW